MYDIFFISYKEINADENYNDLISKFPIAKRVHGVEGIHEAHIEAAKLSDTNMFWVVDGDAKIVDGFDFDFKVMNTLNNPVYVWQAINPVNGLQYGYGGVKLLTKKKSLTMSTKTIDMTTNISNEYYQMNAVSNITVFNTDPFNTWRSAFRECVKLSLNDDKISNKRLTVWKTVSDGDYGEYAIRGAKQGEEFVKNNSDKVYKINDFNWLEEKYKELIQW